MVEDYVSLWPMQVDAEVCHEIQRPCSHAEGLGICGRNCCDDVGSALVRSGSK